MTSGRELREGYDEKFFFAIDYYEHQEQFYKHMDNQSDGVYLSSDLENGPDEETPPEGSTYYTI
jgi:hypothetical protein